MLDSNILSQVSGIFAALDADFTLAASVSQSREEAAEITEFLRDFASTSPRLSVTFSEATGDTLEFSILKNGEPTGVKFRGIPNGHEFTSLLLAILNADGKGKNLPDEAITRRIKALAGEVKLQTFVSLSCTNCPDIVQALNIMAILNPVVTHEMIDGALFQQEADAMKIQAVPTVYANGKMLHVGRGTLGQLLEKLEQEVGVTADATVEAVTRDYDVVVAGGGPAGASAAIYLARKGLKVAIVAENVGGQVKETVDIENLISVPHTTGAQLANSLRTHINDYPIDIFENRRIAGADLQGKLKTITVIGGETFTSKAVIIATGAGWRKLNVPGEADYIGRGVAFCPHCDGPLYADRHVAVIGGGNSGIEAAIDLAGICRKVTVIEFADTLRADQVLQDKARSLGNVEIFMSTQTTQVIGNGEKVIGIQVKDRLSDQERRIDLDGIFVQIGLTANSAPFADQLSTTPIGEIIIDAHCRTSLPGVYAAGDVSSVPYKQIVISMGEGAKAALTAFDDLIRTT